MRNVLILGEQEVIDLLDPGGCLAAVERSFAALQRGEVFLPLRPMIRPPGASGLLALMPVYRGGEEPLYGLKTIAVVPDNPSRGLDPHQGTVSIYDGITGQTVAVMNAAPITAVRTAAASALATRLLARKDAHVLAVVGAGHQAHAHLAALPRVRDFDDIRIASRTYERAEQLAGHHAAARAVTSIEEAVVGADVIVTVTTSPEPVVSRGWVGPGTHINAVGSSFPHARELDSHTVADSTLFVDRRESAQSESGDYLVPLKEGAIGKDHIRAELGEVVIGEHPGRTDTDEITVFDSLGLAVQDLYAAEYVLERARESGRGTTVEL